MGLLGRLVTHAPWSNGHDGHGKGTDHDGHDDDDNDSFVNALI